MTSSSGAQAALEAWASRSSAFCYWIWL